MLTVLPNLVNPNVRLHPSGRNNEIIIKESGDDSKIKELAIQDVPTSVFAFELDFCPAAAKDKSRYQQLSCYVNPDDGSGVNKSCDFVVVFKYKSKLKVLLGELKSDDIRDAKKQLKNSELFLKYLISLAKTFHDVTETTVEFRHLVLNTKRRPMEKGPIGKTARSNWHVDLGFLHIKPNAHKKAVIKFFDMPT
ncbi:hypothetical protein PsAD13_05290 [Pseudovibrio sp. Ad13]|uniref:hypothetical protein n=1 Tax=Pseudovibrio sp. Ad13 TaxID=989396 RepID=UPI0007AE3D84|nr:hypothetical protein [Pseudovibrio sp. Ad13]KZK75852.1 hypothetical protein PsAD13_05290 [Pseudovibrio sp. Ad13]